MTSGLAKLVRLSPHITTYAQRLGKHARTMATAYQIQVGPEDTGLWKANHQTDEAAKKVSELLQRDLKEHHCFFNTDGFHNHIAHHLLTLYGTGAGSAPLQKGYDDNTSYQRSTTPRLPQEMRSWDDAKQYLGKEQYYSDFLVFFQKEIDKMGWEAVMAEYVFKGDGRADDLLGRLFAGFLHPLIQLMFGMEWNQPAIVAEALAQTCVHGTDITPVLLEAEKMADAAGVESMPSILSLMDDVRADKKLAGAAHMSDANKVRDGVVVRARDEMLRIAARVRVRPEELDEKTAEMFNTCIYVAAAAAVHPPKVPKFDFFLMHHITSAPIFPTINAQKWITAETKARVLEWKIRMDLIQYAGRACPAVSVEALRSYRPKAKTPPASTPAELTARLHGYDDEGHAIKLARGALIGLELSRPYEDRSWMLLKGDDLWSQVFHLIVDSVEAPGAAWVRTTGLEEAWANFGDAPELYSKL